VNDREQSPLSRYAAKRAFHRTPEPSGVPVPSRDGPLGFVLQLHRARREHYDFRLELDGVLKSWAVPNGLPTDVGQKRLAVETEDHPLEYASFEGTIPKGEYGAGLVIVWDCGVYAPLELGGEGLADRRAAEDSVRAQLRAGALKFTLRGTKVKGSYALVRTDDCWLVIRHADPWPLRMSAPSSRSALSGLTLPDASRAHDERELPFPTGTPEPLPRDLSPMLAKSGEAAVSRPGWRCEPKLDGYRALAFVDGGRVRLRSRNGQDLAPAFPQLAEALAAQDADLVLDGEIVALDEAGRPSFAALQKRAKLAGPAAREADSGSPAVYVAFDVLHVAGLNVRRCPYRARRRALEQVVLPGDRVQLVATSDDAEGLYRAALAAGHEGVIAKRLDAPYLPGRRTDAWLKIKPAPSLEFTVAGYTRTDRGIGALLLGEWQDGRLAYVGSVGTGLERAGGIAALQRRLDALATREIPLSHRPNLRRPITWVRPELVVEVTYRERTTAGRLRQPVFQRVRDDLKSRTKAAVPAPDDRVGEVLAQLERAPDAALLKVGRARVPVTNLAREYWPASGRAPAITKRDYLKYLARVSPRMLPHLAHRPVTAIRLPAGVGGERFFQKHFERVPDFVSTVDVWSEHRGDAGRYVLCNDLATLLWLAQQGALEFHVWHSRTAASPDAVGSARDFARSREALDASVLDLPDYLVFDLDPYLYSGREAPGDEPEYHARGFAQTKRVAYALRDILVAMGFTPYVKLSGRTGLHVFVVIERTVHFEAARALVGEIGRHLTSLMPADVTMEWSVAKRTGKVFFDHNMNVRGKTLPVAYSPRAVPGAPLSWPVTWDVLAHAEPTDFRIDNLAEHLPTPDAWSTALTDKQNVQRTLRPEDP
jgi:bifunctional non-homologous end joining protein LigD